MTRTSSIRYDGDSVRFILDKHVRLQCGFEHNIYTKLDTLELKLAEQQTAMVLFCFFGSQTQLYNWNSNSCNTLVIII